MRGREAPGNAGDFGVAEIKHWPDYHARPDGDSRLGQAISFEREASPTANTNNVGQVTYYDYNGKGFNDTWMLGLDSRLALTTRVLPDNSTWYQTTDFSDWGPPTGLI